MTVLVESTLGALREHGAGRVPAYEGAIRIAFDRSPPPFGMAWYGEKYRDLATDPDWLAVSLVANATKEGEGARELWELAGRVDDADVAARLQRHAVDESRHALYYGAMLELAFPDALPAEARPALRALSPRFRVSDQPPAGPALLDRQVIDAVIQINLGEIRTRIHQLLLTPVILAHCPEASRLRLSRILAALLGDESRHVVYTGHLLEGALAHGHRDFVLETMAERLDEFNRLTLRQAGEATFTGS